MTSSMSYGLKRRVSIFLRSGLGLQASRSPVQGLLKDARGWMQVPRKSKTPPEQTVHGPKLVLDYPRNWKKHQLQNWQNVRHSKQHAPTGIRVKLEQQCCSCDAVHCEGRQSRETSDLCNFESERAFGKVKRQDMDHIAEKWCVGAVSSFSRSFECTRRPIRRGLRMG